MNVSKDYAIKLHSSENMPGRYRHIDHDKFQAVQRFKQITVTEIGFDNKFKPLSLFLTFPYE